MITIRKSEERGHFNHDWLDTYHTFSFGEYHSATHRGFGSLRVINQDRVQPLSGFPEHHHENMEIITYMVSGNLTHKDSEGHQGLIRAGDVQRMTAGAGISHSEANRDDKDVAHFLQIWIRPSAENLHPGYEQKNFNEDTKKNFLRLIASEDGRDGSITVRQDVNLYASVLENNRHLHFDVPAGRHVWIQVVRGGLVVNDSHLSEGDGAAITDESELHLVGVETCEFLLFDLA